MRRGLAVIGARAEALRRFMDAYARLARLPPPQRAPVAVGALVQRAARLETRVPVQLRTGPRRRASRPTPTSSSSSSSTCCATRPTRRWRRAAACASAGTASERGGRDLGGRRRAGPAADRQPVRAVLHHQAAGLRHRPRARAARSPRRTAGSLALENRADARGCRAPAPAALNATGTYRGRPPFYNVEQSCPNSLPRLPALLLRALLPRAERDEVLADVAAEYAARAEAGAASARRWLWRQVVGSAPALLGWSWWRGLTGFEPRANRIRPGGPMLESWITDVRYARAVCARARLRRCSPCSRSRSASAAPRPSSASRARCSSIRCRTPRRARSAIFWNTFDWSEQEFLYLRARVPRLPPRSPPTGRRT